MKTLTGEVKLPSREQMMEDLENDILKRKASNQLEKYFHKLGWEVSEKYFDDLSLLGKLKPIAPVQLRMFNDALMRIRKDVHNFRENIYNVIDDETFEVIEKQVRKG